MSFAAAVLTETPLYVWAILAYLVWQGWSSLQTQVQPLWRMMMVPLVAAASGLALLLRDSADAGALPWFAAALPAAMLGAVTAPRILSRGPEPSIVTRAGSSAPMLRNLVVFGAHYGLAVASSLHPEAQEAHALAGSLLSGATVGYVAGWSLACLRNCRLAPPILNRSAPAPSRS